ncbi:aspartic peptidase domain-containing protein [Cantharellus anzutake]|uniref:aspartic peptidase domain-containing protein n=1 Tax=Cantharellus anzutake TaxID=1750568 RepID=UPI001904D1E8|nr:aspartic peptidase domain-containing protein [Cantharellus anzutake]KAF8326642.1 aspartic peptidase domain-containing protein [Cantharellus anzutake]
MFAFSLCSLLWCTSLLVAATPKHDLGKRTSIALKTRDWNSLSDEEKKGWFLRQKINAENKYNTTPRKGKRAKTGTIQLVDLSIDAAYVGAIQVGTPSQAFNVLLDTGSTDLWLASQNCSIGCSTVTNRYDPTKSSSYKDTSSPLHIRYGSGAVSGTIGTETVSFGGFTVTQQPFGVIDQITSGIINEGGDFTGLMGLAWPRLAQTRADPAWLASVKAKDWTQPLFAFFLKRYSDQPTPLKNEPNGGSMDIGFTDSSKYTGNISYIPLTSESYWAISIGGVTVNGQKSLITGTAAIDTGTSLIGGPSDQVSEFYSHIPSAQALTGENQGFWVYPCTTKVEVSFSFGGVEYKIDPRDFSRTLESTGEQCLGSIFELGLGANPIINWVVGDSFMKNVYSVFRQDPPAVGFAVANQNNNGGNPTTGQPITTGSATGSTTGSTTGTRTPAGTQTRTRSTALSTTLRSGGGSVSRYSINDGLVSIVGAMMAVIIGVMIAL